MNDFIEPDDGLPPGHALEEDLLARGLPPDVANRIAAWATSDSELYWWPNGLELNSLSERTRIKSLVHECAAAGFGGNHSLQAPLRRLFALLCEGVVADRTGKIVEPDSSSPYARRMATVDFVWPLFKRLDLDIEAAVRESEDDDFMRLAISSPSLYAQLHPKNFLDLGALRAWDPTKGRTSQEATTPDHLAYWLSARGAPALRQLLEVVAAEPPNTTGCLASALLQEVRNPIGTHEGRALLADLDATTSLEDAAHGWLSRIEQERSSDTELLHAAFKAVELITYEGVREPSGATRKLTKQVAVRALGLLRVTAREGSPDLPEGALFAWRRAHSAALCALARESGLAAMLASGTQILRNLSTPCVTDDLRWWNEPNQPSVPHQWSWLPMAMASLVHTRGRIEQRNDPDLKDSRSRFGEFLLKRLRPRRGADDPSEPSEPDPVWRACYIRAVQELDVNPGGRGHKLLFNVQNTDIDDHVKRVAHGAHHALRNAGGNAEGRSPRVRLMAALWWLRQAHLTSLGIEIDGQGARRTRRREISMATDEGLLSA